jgi:hypothetical protein
LTVSSSSPPSLFSMSTNRFWNKLHMVMWTRRKETMNYEELYGGKYT